MFADCLDDRKDLFMHNRADDFFTRLLFDVPIMILVYVHTDALVSIFHIRAKHQVRGIALPHLIISGEHDELRRDKHAVTTHEIGSCNRFVFNPCNCLYNRQKINLYQLFTCE